MSVPDPRIVERWRTTFAMWRSSGLSVAAFCRSRELNLSSFYRWRQILDDLDRPSATRPRSEPDPLPVQSFVPVRVIPDAVVEVILPSGVQLRVPLSADARQLARLVLALGAEPC
jgi:transposase